MPEAMWKTRLFIWILIWNNGLFWVSVFWKTLLYSKCGADWSFFTLSTPANFLWVALFIQNKWFVNVSKLHEAVFQRTHHGLFHGFWFLALLHHPHLLCVSIVTNIPIMTTTSAPVTLICSLQSKSVPSLSPYVWSLSPGSPILSDGQSHLVCAQMP